MEHIIYHARATSPNVDRDSGVNKADGRADGPGGPSANRQVSPSSSPPPNLTEEEIKVY